MLCNKQAKTDRTIPSNKPDIIIRNNEKGKRVLIDTALSEDRNVIKKKIKNILKHKTLQKKVQCLWSTKQSHAGHNRGKWNHISSFRVYPSNTWRKHEIKNNRKLPY
jgi:hypothetical protein